MLELNGISIEIADEPRLLNRLLRIRKKIRGGGYDAVLSFLEAPNFICELAGLPGRKWKLVVGERNSDPSITRSLKLFIYRWFHLFADHIVSNSYSNLNQVYAVCPVLARKKGMVIYNIVDFNVWKPDESDFLRKDSQFLLLVSARHADQKNLRGLAEAVSLLPETDKSRLKIEWYGDRIEEPFIDDSYSNGIARIKSLDLSGIFSFHPATHDITAKIRKATVVGLFSHYEGLPNSILEAMSCGRPVISSGVSDIPRFLNYNSRLLCNPEDPHSIKKCIEYVMHLTAEDLISIGKKNYRLARTTFDREKILSSYLDLLSNRS
jgi:glycosyltransferase involved in cell wall biosynthesis